MNVRALSGRFNCVVDPEVYDTQVLVRILMSRLNKHFSSFCSGTDDSYSLYATHLTRSGPNKVHRVHKYYAYCNSVKSLLIYAVFQK